MHPLIRFTLALGTLLLTSGAANATPPLSGLPVIQVTDRVSPTGLDQLDIDEALDLCIAATENGCNLEFIEGTYTDVAIDVGVSATDYPEGIALYGAGIGETILEGYVHSTYEDWDAAIQILPAAPDGGDQGSGEGPVIIQDLTIDGLKSQQPPPSLDGSGAHMAINTQNVNASTRRNGVIERVEIRNFTGPGIQLIDAPEWTVRDSWIHDLGCDTSEEPCGTTYDWEAESSIISPGDRKTNATAVLVGVRSDDVVVEDNVVSDVTKYGLGVFAPGTVTCDGTDTAPYRTQILRNRVTRAGSTGIGVNGGCDLTIEGNTVAGVRQTNAEAGTGGYGFICEKGGGGSEWIDNVASHNMNGGYRINCQVGDVNSSGPNRLENNVSRSNCQTTTFWASSDLQFRNGGGDVEVVNHRGLDAHLCTWGVWINNTDDVSISASQISGGSDGGLSVEDGSSGISFSNVRVLDDRTPADGGDISGDAVRHYDGLGGVYPSFTDFTFDGFTYLVCEDGFGCI